NVLAVVPLFYDSIQPTDGGPVTETVTFDVPAGTSQGAVALRLTGHGGGTDDAFCLGPNEEFCERAITVAIDGQSVDTLDPWRTDCGSLCTTAHYGPADGGFDYCAENPCGDPNSVAAPRANWCPGSETPPFLEG